MRDDPTWTISKDHERDNEAKLEEVADNWADVETYMDDNL